MASELRNEFTWSTSRDRLFRACARAYWWRYYAHWGGWLSDAPEPARVAYRLGKMENLDSWAGSIVHDVIEEAVGNLRDHGRPVDPGRLAARARERLRRGWVESRDGAWRQRPKHATSLWEHYYGRSEHRAPARTEEIAQRVYECLDGFARGPWPALLARVPRDAFRNIEDLSSLRLDGRTVWVKPDLAFEHPDDGRLVLVDWKTGRMRGEDDFQLATYALFAWRSWGIEPERSSAVLVYLASGQEKRVALDRAVAEAAEARICESMEAMLGRLREPGANRGCVDDFPMASDPLRCERCQFRQLCFGAVGVPGAALAGDVGADEPPRVSRAS